MSGERYMPVQWRKGGWLNLWLNLWTNICISIWISFHRYLVKAVHIKCKTCISMIKQPAGVVDPTTSDDSTYQPYQQMIISREVRDSAYSKLIDSKNRGGLCDPTEFLIRLVTISERVIRLLSSDTNQVISIERLNIEVLRELGGPASAEFHTHAIQTQSGITNHYFSLIKKILTTHLSVRMFYICKRAKTRHCTQGRWDLKETN